MLTDKQIEAIRNETPGIEKSLKDIAQAQYGEDVRGAIYASIYSCYKDGKAGSVDLVARSQITEMLSGDIEGLEVQMGEYEVAFAEDKTEGKYDIAFGEPMSGTPIVLISSSNFNASVSTSEITSTGFRLHAKAPAGDSAVFSWVAFYGNNAAASEVAGIRTAYDGTTYATAGDAVRGQAERAFRQACRNVNELELWEQGAISTSTGNNGSDNPMRLRTVGYIPNTVTSITVGNGYLANVFMYDGDAFVGTYNGSTIDSQALKMSGYIDWSEYAGKYNIRLGLMNIYSSGVNITVDESQNTFLWSNRAREVADDFSIYNHHTFLSPADYYGFYRSTADTVGFSGSTTAAEYFMALNSAIAGYEDYVSAEIAGTASDGTSIYKYTFVPAKFGSGNISVVERNRTRAPHVIITAGIHGSEKSSCFGLYYFICDLLRNWRNSPVLEYLRNHVVFTIIPIVNPHGFSNNARLNANGVDINRNFPAGWEPATNETDPSRYPGESPASEPETIIVKGILDSITSPFLFIDFHTYGAGAVAEYWQTNWIPMLEALIADSYGGKLYDAAINHAADITAHFADIYSLENKNSLLSRISYGGEVGTSAKYANSLKILGTSFEGFNGFVGSEAFTDEVQHANAELIGNFLGAVFRKFARR